MLTTLQLSLRAVGFGSGVLIFDFGMATVVRWDCITNFCDFAAATGADMEP